jgi:hypothetical protein
LPPLTLSKSEWLLMKQPLAVVFLALATFILLGK